MPNRLKMVSSAPWLLLSALVILCDQLSKAWALKNLTFNEPEYVMPFINLYLDFNTGAAFSFLDAYPKIAMWLFGGIALMVSAILVIYLIFIPVENHFQSAALALILGGAVGNLADRLHYQHVVDFINWHVDKPYISLLNSVFNVADAAITLGTFLLLFSFMLRKK